MIVFFHLANVLFLISYAVKDILALRAITVLAGIALLSSFLVQDNPPWPAVAWQSVFFVINVVRIHLLLLERRPVPLSADEQFLHAKVFRDLRPRELARLVRVGAIVHYDPNATIVERGKPLDRLLLVVHGDARVEIPDDEPIKISNGAFIGELGYLTGKPPGANVVAESKIRLVAWPTKDLRELLDTNPELDATMQQVLGSDLAMKLRR